MKKSIGSLIITAFIASYPSTSDGQATFHKFTEAVVYNPEMNPYMTDPNQALIESINDSLINFENFKIDSEHGTKNKESKSDLADPNLDLKMTKSDYNVLITNFKKDSEVNIQKNEKCLNDLKVSMIENKRADSTVLKTDIEFLGQKNSELKKKLVNYYNSHELKEFSSFKNNFDEALEAVTNAILELAVNVRK